MKLLDFKKEKAMMTARLHIDRQEFAAALDQAYLDEPERFFLPGQGGAGQLGDISPTGPSIEGSPDAVEAPPREKLEKLYGPTVLYEEALDIAIPAAFGDFVSERGLSLASEPEVAGVEYPEGGGVDVTIRAELFPEVEIDGYKGIAVQFAGDEEAFAKAVMQEAIKRLRADLPESLIKGRLETVLTQEKLIVNRDPIYSVLADVVSMLESTFRALDVVQPKSEIRSKAMDIMLETVAPDQAEPTKGHFRKVMAEAASTYRRIPDGFDAELDRIIEKRRADKAKMTPEQRAEDVFNAYIGSLKTSAEQWLEQRRELAIEQIKQDLLLDEVARREQIQATQQEVDAAYDEIARQYDSPVEQVKASIPPSSIGWQLCREKAMQLIVESAIRLPGQEA